jgi:hypothetical protein
VKQAFIGEISDVMNTHNVSRYLYAFANRSDITLGIQEKLDK